MKKRVKFLGLGILVIIILSMVVVGMLVPIELKPTELVTNRTFEISESMLLTCEIIRYPTGVEITELESANVSIGLTVDPWNLNFGMIPTGGSYGRRFLILTNLREREAKVKLRAYGNISPMVEFGKSDFILNKNENVTIDVFLRTTNETLPGNYTGRIDVTIIRPKYGFVYSFLEWL